MRKCGWRFFNSGSPSSTEPSESQRSAEKPCTAPVPARGAQRITSAIDQLEVFPHIGREVEELPEGFRELVVSFGNDGYVVLYEASPEQVTITAIRHQREAGF